MARTTLVLLNGNVYTMDAQRPRARAVAIDQHAGYISAVGDNTDVRAATGAHTEVIDLRGCTVLPGFIDAHIHLLGYAERRARVQLDGCTSEDEAAERVRLQANQTPPGEWIGGDHWDKNLWPGGAFPTKASLDYAAPNHPVALWSKDGHVLWVNSRALERAGITRETPDPPGGTILRDAQGEPTGILQEYAAAGLVDALVTRPGPEESLRLLRRALHELLSHGITGIHDIEDDTALRLFEHLRDRGELAVRVVMYLPRYVLPELLRLGLQSGFGDHYLRIGGIKIFADGTLGSQTAAMLQPFEGQPENRGILAITPAEMNAVLAVAAGGGVSVAIHAIGDRACRIALNGIEQALKTKPRGPARGLVDPHRLRFRLEHVQLIAPEDITRMAQLGVIASVQPFHAVADRDIAERYWGRRARRAYPYATMLEQGVSLALGSDAPVETFDSLRILHAAVVRRDDQTPHRPPWTPDQALPLNRAIWAYTLGAAYAGGEERLKGTITEGKLGDLVVLREDPFTIPPERLTEAGIMATIVGGQLMFGELP
jgi:predicted amidohydrolase YtcJ